MRLQFQDQPLDLYGSILYTLAMAAAVVGLGVGNVFAILLVVFVPGYVLAAFLFPGKHEIDWINRIGLSIGLSIVVVPLLGLILSFTPFGIHSVPIVSSITLFTIALSAAAYLRRMRLPVSDRLSATIFLNWGGLGRHNLIDRALTIALVLSIVFASVVIVFISAVPPPDEPFTEFYVLGAGGNATGYPMRLNVTQQGTVIIGIVNHEKRAFEYAVRVDRVGLRQVYNTTLRANATLEVNRTTLSWLNFTLGEGRTWTRSYTFSLDSAGLWKVQLNLFKDAEPSNQELHIFVRVS